MIKFSARGHEFEIPLNYIEDHMEDGNIFKIMAKNNNVDKLGDHIYIDINPIYINNILDIVINKELCLKNIIFRTNILLAKELEYLSLYDELYMDISDFGRQYSYLCSRKSEKSRKKYDLRKLYLSYIVDNNDYVEYRSSIEMDDVVETIDITDIKFDIYVIHTYDGKSIVLKKSSIMLWKKCKFTHHIIGQNTGYVKNITDNKIEIWIPLNYYTINIFISIMRDGISDYIEFLRKQEMLEDVIEWNITDQNIISQYLHKVEIEIPKYILPEDVKYMIETLNHNIPIIL